MNYQEYLELKNNCERKLKWFNSSIYIIALFSLFQTALLVFKININFIYVNMIILDKLFSLGYNRYTQGNIVFSVAFYAAYACIILLFLYSCYYSRKQRRRGYYGVIMLYAIDSILCIATFSFIQLGVHVLLLLLVMLALRNRNYLRLLKNNVWGYQ